MKSTTQIPTQHAARIAKRLVNHWKHKFEVQEHTGHFEIMLPQARVKLTPHAQSLEVSIQWVLEADDPTQLEMVVLDHLIRMGQEPLTAYWKRD